MTGEGIGGGEVRLKELMRLRQAVADYMASEGCGCCRSEDRHDEAKERLANLLGVPAYSDGSGFDFAQFTTEHYGEVK